MRPTGFLSVFKRLDSRFVPFGTTVIFENPRAVARLLLAIGAGATINLTVIAIWLGMFGEAGPALISAGTAVGFLAATVWFFTTGRARRPLLTFLWLSLANNIAIHLTLGGYSWSGVWLGWGTQITATAALFLGRRRAALFAGIYVLLAIVLAFAEGAVQSWRNPPASSVSSFLAADMFIASLLILALLTSLLVDQVSREHKRANGLLLNVLPEPIVERLKNSEDVIADRFDQCSVLFADIVGFTRHSHEVSPERVVDELNHIFSRFDTLVEAFGVEKIKTIGDGYMAVAGAPIESDTSVESICGLALEMQREIENANRHLGTDFDVRIGLHTGTAIAGVIGQSRFSYDMWGDTVNIASRMESQGKPGKIQATSSIRANASDHFEFEPAGMIQVKGVGDMEVFHLTGARGTLEHDDS